MTVVNKRLVVSATVIACLALAWTADVPRSLMLWALFDGRSEGYAVSFTDENMYAVEGFSFSTEHSDFDVPRGILVPGTTEVGTTVVLVLGDGTWTARDPGHYQWKNMSVAAGSTRVTEPFSSIYLRIHPRFYDQLLAAARVTETRDPDMFARAEKIFKHKFWNSYHSNERALIPSADIGAIDIESNTWGRVQIREATRIGGIAMPSEVLHWDYEGDPPAYMN